MKKRIISGVVMGVVVALVLVLGLSVENLIITTFVAIVAALGVIEMISNAAKIQNMIFRMLSAIYTVVMVFLFCNINEFTYKLFCTDYNEAYVMLQSIVGAIVASVVYVIACAVLILVYQEEFDLGKITALCGMPLLYAYGFSTLASIIIAGNGIYYNGIYYLLLILNFACVCDMGAYFVGVSMGKTKLCPAVSPNKTVEGALGGIVSSIIVSLIITLCFGYFNKILPVLLLTIPLCVAGMAGDLFASIIKRKAEIKDYGNLIPGHGGVLDRVDSILFISPLVYGLLLLGAI